jgi:hypothetical protein
MTLDPSADAASRPARRPTTMRGRKLVLAVLAALALVGCAGNLECDGHPCVGDWKRQMALGGTVVRCADGSWSHAGGLQGACSGHGGKR